MVPVVIALGSNLGDSEGNLRAAFERLCELIADARMSSIWETEPMYLPDQPRFRNAAVAGCTRLGPLGLFRRMKRLEQEMGRVPTARNGPRLIDLDLVVYGGLRYRFTRGEETVLEVPHPRAHERPFVLGPWAEIEPEGQLPGMGSIRSLLERL
jgi:2-amino-4-hydroxy-6-hydroxymethyldihydropteridine diphosphokinase